MALCLIIGTMLPVNRESEGDLFMRYYEQDRDCIDFFREEYEFLNNFYISPME